MPDSAPGIAGAEAPAGRSCGTGSSLQPRIASRLWEEWGRPSQVVGAQGQRCECISWAWPVDDQVAGLMEVTVRGAVLEATRNKGFQQAVCPWQRFNSTGDISQSPIVDNVNRAETN